MREFSFGIIPLRRSKKGWEVFLVQHQAGHWAFPKGHAEKGETPQQAAERELFEETGLQVNAYLFPEPLQENYFFTFNGKRIFKTVSYFLAEVVGESVIQEAELSAGKWLSLEQAMEQMSFREGKNICKQAQELLAS